MLRMFHRRATIQAGARPALSPPTAAPNAKLVRGVRYVENGNTISSAGITAGVDATLFAL
jgi:transcriptional regulator GlxA family with amidase domain